MFDFNEEKNVAAHYRKKTFDAFIRSTVFNNPYVQYIIQDKYTETLPDYLQPDVIDKIKSSATDIHIYHSDLLEFLKNKEDSSYSKFNLSDIFEVYDQEKTALIFREILRVSEKGAKLIFWNNLVKRDLPKEMTDHFQRQKELEDKLIINDRVFFYSAFRIYKVLK